MSQRETKRLLWSCRFGQAKEAPCFWCGRPMGFDDATVDHLIPRVKGGSNHLTNLVLSCDPCNQSRSVAMQMEGINARGARRQCKK